MRMPRPKESFELGKSVEAAIALFEKQYFGELTHDSGHNSTRPTYIYTFRKFGGAQIAIPLNKGRLSLYIRDTTVDGRSMMPTLEAAGAKVIKRYSTDKDPVSSLKSVANAPYLSPMKKGNRLILIGASTERLSEILDKYFNVKEFLQSDKGGANSSSQESAQGQLGTEAITMLRSLVRHLQDVVAGRPETYLGYKVLHDELGLRLLGGTYGTSVQRQGLESIAEWCLVRDLPAITGIVVGIEAERPSPRYFEMHAPASNDANWWERQVAESKATDWGPYLAGFVPNATKTAIDMGSPGRASTVVSRIIRDSDLAKYVKNLHGFKCQICGLAVELYGGAKYAEAHHVKPLGSPHNGPDTLANIVCVCPNHHAQLDFGAIKIDAAVLRLALEHSLADEFIQYHNEWVYGK